jgi:hypothetical protein
MNLSGPSIYSWILGIFGWLEPLLLIFFGLSGTTVNPMPGPDRILPEDFLSLFQLE